MHRRRSLLSAGGVPYQAHEGLALPIQEIREESNQACEIGADAKKSGIFLDSGISRGICNNSTSRGRVSGQPYALQSREIQPNLFLVTTSDLR